MPTSTATSNPYADQGDQSDGFIVRVYNKQLIYQGMLGGYESLVCTVRHNAISTAELVVRADHPRVAELLLSGARVVIDYDHKLLMSGRMESRGASANAGTPVVTFNVVDDFQYLGIMLGWPVPWNNIDEQGLTSRYYRAAGYASDVAADIIWWAKERTGLNLIVFNDDKEYFHLGKWITIRSRMDSLADVLVAKVDRAGVGIKIGGYGTNQQLYTTFYTPTVRDKVLTVDSGVLVDWSWTQAEPTVTRVVIGGAGEGTVREYQTFVDEAREERYGTIKEVFVDARDIGADYEDSIKDVPDKYKELVAAEKDYLQSEVDKSLAGDTYFHITREIIEYQEDLLLLPAGAAHDRLATKILHLQQEELVYTAGSSNAAILAANAAFAKQIAAQTAYDAAVELQETLKVATDEEFAERAEDVFAEFGTQYGLSLTLAETDSFRYGETFLVGDIVTVALPGATTITDTVREVTISDTVESGLTVAPVVGTQDTMAHPNRVLVNTIAKLKQAARKLNTSR